MSTKTNRRRFLKLAGAGALGLAASPLGATLLAPGEAAAAISMNFKRGENALTAKRWAMVIDSREFTREDLERVSHACHSIHNVPTIEGDLEVKWIWTDTFHHVFTDKTAHYQSHAVEERKYLALCNHCENPPCVRVCPTKATFQREDGIVTMDMHRCIGCRFCMAGCPFGARSFNFMDPRPHIAEMNPDYPTRTKGVVEKCNFCAERLAEGLMPACVEASEGKMYFGDLKDPDSEVRHVLAENYSIRRKPALGTEPGVYYIV